jgi:hypothetical protein
MSFPWSGLTLLRAYEHRAKHRRPVLYALPPHPLRAVGRNPVDDRLRRYALHLGRRPDARKFIAVVNKAVSGHRAELIRETAEPRVLLTRELEQQRRAVQSASTHYRSPVQMLMRDTLGSERRSRIMGQIASSGPAELASLAEYAAAQKDKDLAAALCSRVADLPRADRPFSAAELADVMCGELHRELSQALVEAERRVLEALEDEQVASTGRGNPQRSLEIAMLRRRESEIGAYRPDDETEDDQTDTDATEE